MFDITYNFNNINVFYIKTFRNTSLRIVEIRYYTTILHATNNDFNIIISLWISMVNKPFFCSSFPFFPDRCWMMAYSGHYFVLSVAFPSIFLQSLQTEHSSDIFKHKFKFKLWSEERPKPKSWTTKKRESFMWFLMQNYYINNDCWSFYSELYTTLPL